MEANDSYLSSLPPNAESSIVQSSTSSGRTSGDVLGDLPPPDEYDEIPSDLLFNDSNLLTVIVYTVLCAVSAVGNTTVFGTLWRYRRLRTRSSSIVNLFVMHLSVADLIVTFVMMPLEIGWNVTVAWKAGDVACRLLMFFRAFGFYLSSFVLVAISLDRCFAVARPLLHRHTTSNGRGRAMLVGAWVLSAVASAPQSVIFHVESHPKYRWFAQCVTFNFFPTRTAELAYNLFNLAAIYFVPLVVIIASYTCIICVISRKARQRNRDRREVEEAKVKGSEGVGGRPLKVSSGFLLRSSTGKDLITQARSRTLKMTIVIVLVFIVCWTPYFVISAWWWFDRHSAEKISPKVQKGLFLFAVSNACMDPIVYGMFSNVFRKSMTRQWSRLKASFVRSQMTPLYVIREQ